MSSPKPQETESQADSSDIQLGNPDASAPSGLEGPSTPRAPTGRSQSPSRGPPSDSSSSTPTGPVRTNPVTSGPSTSGVSASISFSTASFPAWTSGPVTSIIPAARHRGPHARQRPNLLRPGLDFPVFDMGINEFGPRSGSQTSSAPPRPVVHIDGTVGPAEAPDHNPRPEAPELPIPRIELLFVLSKDKPKQPPSQPAVGFGQNPAQGHYYGADWYPPYAAIYPVYAAGQSPFHDPLPGTTPGPFHVGLQALQAPHEPQVSQESQEPEETPEERENRERDERIRRYREQHERAISFSEEDDAEFIPHITNP
ncbi:hypothetical protein F4811DRAFT_557553 [Daldinia bambusicola]|nr:hypothetical protein F4811DRAFT_557553 [Daldinia bambusicola]